jgi:hypothetical protein
MPRTSVAVAKRNDRRVDVREDTVFALHEEAVRSDDLGLQLLSSFEGILLGVAVAHRGISQMYV